jgi:hypothetical protein
MSIKKQLSGKSITAKNGHLSFEIESASTSFLPILSKLLQEEFGCVSVGETSTFVSEIISDIELNGLKFGLGWDNWSGAYVMALCDQGDQQIKEFAVYLNEEIKKVEYCKYASM